jgi:DNA-binding GntR family transcriptional regulator
MDEKTVTPGPVNERIMRDLRMRLMRGELAPGEILTHRKLAEQLDVSPQPVRDALRQLVAERALEVVNGNRSVAVPRLDRVKLFDLKTIRQGVEGLAARLAAERWKPHEMTQIEAILAETADGGDMPEASRNQRFHFAIYAASQSEVLIPLISSLWLQFGPYLPRAGQLTDGKIGAGDMYHREIVSALRARDADAAEAAIKADIGQAMDLLLNHGLGDAGPERRG